MREVLDDIDRWRRAGKRVAIARVVGVDGSGPREPGAALAVSEDGEVAGSVSGGCVEGALVDAALAALATGERGMHVFGGSGESSASGEPGESGEPGGSGDDPFAVGLTCGGTLRVFLEPLDRRGACVYDEFAAAVRAGHPVALATVIDGPRVGSKLLVTPGAGYLGTFGDAHLDRAVARDADEELAAGGTTRVRRYGPHGETRRHGLPVFPDVPVFLEVFVPPPTMLVLGAVDFAAALVRVAKALGYTVTVCDARPVFATRARFPLADDIVVDWPHRHLGKAGPALTRRDAVCILTHDPRFDVPAIVAALGTDVGYLGVMGSRRTHLDRVGRLRAAGVDDAGLARVYAPIGLDIGARTPEETAVSICTEIISVRAGRCDTRSLRSTDGPIHRRQQHRRP